MYIWSILWLFFKFEAVVNYNYKDRPFIMVLIPSIELVIVKEADSTPQVILAFKWLNLGFVVTIDFFDFVKERLYNIMPGIRLQQIV